MRFRIVLLAAAALVALALAGCGNRKLNLGVDALSFADPASLTTPIPPVLDPPLPPLPVPVEVSTGEQLLFSEEVNMLGGTQQVVDVQSATITCGIDYDGATPSGIASGTLLVYMSDSNTDPRSTAPVVTVPVALAPGHHEWKVRSLGGPIVNALFTQDQVKVAVTSSFVVPANQAPSGVLNVTALRVDVIAKHHTTL